MYNVHHIKSYKIQIFHFNGVFYILLYNLKRQLLLVKTTENRSDQILLWKTTVSVFCFEYKSKFRIA